MGTVDQSEANSLKTDLACRGAGSCTGVCTGCGQATVCAILPEKLAWEGTALLHVYREWAELWARRDGWYIGAEGLVRCWPKQAGISANPIRIGGRR